MLAIIPKTRRQGFDPRRFHHWIAFGLGSGLVPWAPGTFGTLAAIPLYLLLSCLAWPSYLIAVGILTLIGIWACGLTARELGAKDPSVIVWDEFVGFWITMAVIPYDRLLAPGGWFWLLAGFLTFRLFDIWKPWPIYLVDEQVSGGVGIMFDDILAGLMAGLVLLGLLGFEQFFTLPP